MPELIRTTWFLPTLIGVVWFGVCIVDFAVVRPWKGKRASWIEIVIALVIGVFLVGMMIPTVDHFGPPASTRTDAEDGANNTPEDIRR